VKAEEDKLLERCIEGSGIFLISAGRPIMMNSVLEGLNFEAKGVRRYPLRDLVNTMSNCVI